MLYAVVSERVGHAMGASTRSGKKMRDQAGVWLRRRRRSHEWVEILVRRRKKKERRD